jgi:hypothetical protein
MNAAYPDDPWSLVMWEAKWNDSQIAAFKQSSPLPVSETITTEDATTAYTRVLADAGATRPKRDAVDSRLVNDVKLGLGRIIDDESEVGGWPPLASTRPPTDSDHDGMPDLWETERRLNPNDPSDGARDMNGDGYTNVEEYLNDLTSE